jgi:dCMP deaminase
MVPKDGVPANVHPLNLVEIPDADSLPEVTRPPLYEVYMRMAEELAKRSTCLRLRVGTVLTDPQMENVVAIGYNGNARGFPNSCDSTEPGRCGCIHSEQNALVKAPGHLRGKVAFVTASPCVACAKLMIQANVGHLFYRQAYRDPKGLDVLREGGVVTVLYTRWMNDWR